MTLRRFELLVNEVRESTDTKDINSIGAYEVMRYFNDAQKQIQKIIFTANPSADIFVRQATYDITDRTQVAYELPSDIYAHNSVNSLMSVKDGRIAQSLTRVAYREKEALWGYALLDNSFVLTSSPDVSTISQILVNYVYRLPVMGYRIVQSTSAALGSIINMDLSTLIDDEGYTERYDKYSFVDSNGVIKASELTLSIVGLDYTFDGDISGVEIGDWLVCGDFGTSHSCLPPACEPYLMSYVQRRILNKISSTEVASENVFTTEERADIEDLFKDNVKDALYPVSSDTDYLGI